MAIKERHKEILRLLNKAEAPLSGASLSSKLGVSRQIIVSDIDKIRAEGHMILSTPKGYILVKADSVERVFKVYHTAEQTEEELNLIVDLGATVKDVFIYHHVYNEVHAKLNISSRRDVQIFCDDIKNGRSSPLLSITGGYHYHTISAKDAETLSLVEQALWEHGFLSKLTDYEPTALTKYFEGETE